MISLIHPSRGRPEKSFNTSKEWIERAGCETELILSIDDNDNSKEKYFKAYDYWSSRPVQRIAVTVNDNNSVVSATNKAAALTRGDVMVYLSDDFSCFDNWGKAIEEEFTKYSGTPALVKVDDCLQKYNVPVLTIPIMNRVLYDKLGYFWHPGYKSMFVDEHLYWRARKLNALKFAEHLKFEHRHVSVGKAKDDDTYRRSAANWDHGKSLFAQHKMEGFVH